MTPLVLSMALTAAAQPPAPPFSVPPVILYPQASIWGRPASLPPPTAPYTAFPVTPPLIQHAPLTPPSLPVYPVVQPVLQPVQLLPQPVQPVPQPVAPRAVTLVEFSRVFTPLPGKHEVWLIHPYTRQPVLVCFTLPPGKLRDFEVTRDEIRFQFARCEVDILFRKNGTVRVEYND